MQKDMGENREMNKERRCPYCKEVHETEEFSFHGTRIRTCPAIPYDGERAVFVPCPAESIGNVTDVIPPVIDIMGED